MSRPYVMTLRLPEDLGLEVERAAARQGSKAAQLGAWFIEEGIRRRKHPLIDLRETSAGRVAYINGTRLAVYWVIQQVPTRRSVEAFAQDYGLSVAQIRAALAYAATYPGEIELDARQAESNLAWIQQQDAAARVSHRARAKMPAKGHA